MKKIISVILILLGIFLLILPFTSTMIIRYRVKAKIDVLEELTREEIEKNNNIQGEYDYSSINDLEISSLISGINKFNNKSIIGQILIPKLDLELPILKGTTNENLLIGATTMTEHQEMGKGNYSLAGHYMKDKRLLFGSLLDIEKDYIVELIDKENIYVYEIYDTIIVEDTDIYMVDDRIAEDRGKPVVSLMSCYYTSKNGKRFFALGELIDIHPYN